VDEHGECKVDAAHKAPEEEEHKKLSVVESNGIDHPESRGTESGGQILDSLWRDILLDQE